MSPPTYLSDYLQDQFIGFDKSRKTIQEQINKAAKDFHVDTLGYVPEKPMALITVHNPGSSIIESIGFSEPDDLVLDNFGKLLGGVISGVNNLVELKDFNGVNNNYRATSGQDSYSRREDSPFVSNVGSKVQLGFGGTGGPWSGPARTDYKIENINAATPWPTPSATNSGVWNPSTSVIITATIGPSQPFTTFLVGECGLFLQIKSTGSSTGVSNKTVMVTHDVAGASVGSEQSVNITYTWSIF